MTKAQRPYSRVYWEAIDDPKFAHVWDDDHALAAWLRLLVAADMAYPASATLYHGIRRSALKVLCDVRLVDMQTAGRYRIHGLDKERSARSGAASAAASARWSSDMRTHPADDADGMRSHSGPEPAGMPSQDEPSRAEQRRDEPSMSRAAEDVWRIASAVEDLVGAFPYTRGSRVYDQMAADVADLGADRVEAAYRALRAEYAADPMDAAGIVFGAHKRLYRIPDAPRTAKGLNPTSDEAWDAFGGRS